MKAELTHAGSPDLKVKKMKIHNYQEVGKQAQHTMKKTERTFTHKHIMLIDDNDLDNFINEKLMQIHHYSEKIYVHTSAISALEFLKNLTTMDDKWKELAPEVIYIDINMPIIDGFQFIELLKKTFEGIIPMPRLIILTSSLYLEDKEKALELSKEIVFLNKPLSKETLEEL